MAALKLRDGKGIEVMSYDFPEADNQLVRLTLNALFQGWKTPRGVKVRRHCRDIYLVWGAGRFIFLRLH